MFYSEHILTKKGPLAKIWLAAHMHNKLTKAMVFSTNISSAVSRIITPDVPMALRLTSNLLLGVVRIFSRKTKYLAADASDAVARLKLAYTAPSGNDLPADGGASRAAITISAPGSNPLDHDLGADMLELDFPGIAASANPARLRDQSSNPTPRYLADARDITIDDYAGGFGTGIIDAFGLDHDLDLLPVDEPERDRLGARSQDEEENDHEPLMFTPSQQRTSSAHSTPRHASSLGSVELMRDAPAGAAGGGTPRLSFDDLEARLASPAPFAGNLTPRTLKKDDGEGMDLATPSHNGIPSPYDGGRAGGVDDGPLFLPADNLILADEENSANGANFMDSDAFGADAGPVPDKDAGAGDDATAASEPRRSQRARSVGYATIADAPGKNSEKGGENGSEGENEGEGKVVSTQEAPSDRAAASVSLQPQRKRKDLPSHMDKETELSAIYFRECLQDTSDIVRPHKRARRGVDDDERGLTAIDIFCRPVFSGLAPELNELFVSCFNRETILRDPGSPISEPTRRLSKRRRDANLSEAQAQAQAGRDASISGRNAEENAESGYVPASPAVDTNAPGLSPKPTEKNDSLPEDATENAQSPERCMTPLPPAERSYDDDRRLSLSAGGRFDGPMIDDAMLMDDMQPVQDLEAPATSPIADQEDERELAQRNLVDEETRDDRRHPTLGPKMTLADVANTRVQVETTSGGDISVNGNGDDPAGDCRMTTRSLRMRDLLAEQRREPDGSIDFTKMLDEEPSVTRRVAARTFYEVLNLCSKRVVTVGQADAYGAILVVPRQPAFDCVGKAGIGSAPAARPRYPSQDDCKRTNAEKMEI
jgi:N terminus of Rad21 / Rec8 like protein/Conserved region of Rad21 / Rec8 like protein